MLGELTAYETDRGQADSTAVQMVATKAVSWEQKLVGSRVVPMDGSRVAS